VLLSLPSSQSSPVSTMPLPQPAGTQSPSLHEPSAPSGVAHVVPSGVSTVVQTCAVMLQVSTPLQIRPSKQSLSSVQVQVQSGSQPSPATALPSSHCSPGSTRVLPQAAASQMPVWQVPPAPSAVVQVWPSSRGVPSTQT
jgi:hypothetical protein